MHVSRSVCMLCVLTVLTGTLQESDDISREACISREAKHNSCKICRSSFAT